MEDQPLALPPGMHPAETEEFPWDRQPQESALHHKYFCVFRDLGPKRTISEAAKLLNRQPATLRELSAGNHWYDRAKSWDRYQDFLFSASIAEERKKAALAQLTDAQEMREKLRKRLKTLNVARLTPQVMGQWLDILVKVERLALGLDTRGPGIPETATQIVQNTTYVDNRKISIDERIKDYQSVFNQLADKYSTPEDEPLLIEQSSTD